MLISQHPKFTDLCKQVSNLYNDKGQVSQRHITKSVNLIKYAKDRIISDRQQIYDNILQEFLFSNVDNKNFILLETYNLIIEISTDLMKEDLDTSIKERNNIALNQLKKAMIQAIYKGNIQAISKISEQMLKLLESQAKQDNDTGLKEINITIDE